MRLFLKRRGCDARHWGLGTNQGDPERDSEILLETVTRFMREHGAPVALVGWSLGGVIAREVARAIPENVSQVITYGTPVIGGPTFTPAADSYGEDECRRIAGRVVELDRESPIRVPVSAIFSRRDGVVSWPACIDRSSPDVVHYEVDSTHLSMGFDPSVWSLVAHRLAGSDLQA
jgi:pimeloyl-ACP methyl ester carboxylesterase